MRSTKNNEKKAIADVRLQTRIVCCRMMVEFRAEADGSPADFLGMKLSRSWLLHTHTGHEIPVACRTIGL